MKKDEQTAEAKRRFLEGIRNAPDRGTGGRVNWTRDELHERERGSGSDDTPSPGRKDTSVP
jgi:hypothetical protein